MCEFGNKMPREGTETDTENLPPCHQTLFGNKMPREGTETVYYFNHSLIPFIWK